MSWVEVKWFAVDGIIPSLCSRIALFFFFFCEPVCYYKCHSVSENMILLAPFLFPLVC